MLITYIRSSNPLSSMVWLEVNMDHLMREYIARFKRPNIDGEQLLSQ